MTHDVYRTGLVVVGSGAAGLTAALSAAARGVEVTVVERTASVGGTSAMSGGLVYAPGTRLAADVGHDMDPAAVLTYLRAVARRPLDEEVVEAYLDAAPDLADFLAARGVGLRLTGLGDYYQDAPGAGTGRVIATTPFDPEELGDWAALIRGNPYRPDPDAVPWTAGMSLIAHLVAACLRAGVVIRTGWRADELLVADGAVRGVRGRAPDGRAEQIEGRNGVVLASGGAEFDPATVSARIPHGPEAAWSCPANTGDGLRMAEAAGAGRAELDVQWYGLLRLTDAEVEGEPLMHDASPARNLPGSIVVDRTGRRFANEGGQFQDFGRALAADGRRPAWLVVDQQFVDDYGPRAFGSATLTDPHWTSAGSVEELAILLGADPETLVVSVARFSESAGRGADPDFGRGATAFDQAWGDPDRAGAAACLAPLHRAPFHATRMYVGCSGTTGGVPVDAGSRVLTGDGSVVPGLYAVGNVVANPFGGAAPGSGSTLGPGMVAGYLVGRAAGASM